MRKPMLLAIGMGLVLSAASAVNAETLECRYPSFERRTASSSIVAASMMGAAGYGAWSPPTRLFEAALLTYCAAKSGTTLWAHGCNPEGMRLSMKDLADQDWRFPMFAPADQAEALAWIVTPALERWRSPAVIPLAGNADHWGVVYRADVDRSTTPMKVKRLWLADALEGDDGAGIGGMGDVDMAGAVFNSMYLRVLRFINPACDLAGCSADPFYDKWVLMADPPAGASTVARRTPLEFVRAEGPRSFQTQSRAELAADDVAESLRLAGADVDPKIAEILGRTKPAGSYPVRGLAPDGSDWAYFLVPFVDARGEQVATGIFSAHDGAYEMFSIAKGPQAIAVADEATAIQHAQKWLKRGEVLGKAQLTWTPRSPHLSFKSPTNPFWQLPIIEANGEVHRAIQVGLLSGQALEPVPLTSAGQ